MKSKCVAVPVTPLRVYWCS